MEENKDNKIDKNLAYFSEKEYGSGALKGHFAKDSDARRRSVEWMSDLAVASAGLALLFRVMTRVVPLGGGPAMLFGAIVDIGVFVGILFTVISAVFVVPLYVKDKKRPSGALGTTLIAIAILAIYFFVTFAI